MGSESREHNNETRSPGSDTATFRSLKFLDDYHPDVRQAFTTLFEYQSALALQEFRAQYGVKDNSKDLGIIADPNYGSRVLELKKTLKEKCDALQRTYVAKTELEKRLRELGQREEQLEKRERLANTRQDALDRRVEEINARETKYRGLEARENQYVENKAVLDQGFKALEAERQDIAKAHAELPELVRAAIAQDKRKAYETAVEIVKKAMVFQTGVQGVLRTAIDASNHEFAAAQKALDDLLYQLKPEEPTPAETPPTTEVPPPAPAEGNA